MTKEQNKLTEQDAEMLARAFYNSILAHFHPEGEPKTENTSPAELTED